jgi:hypothetical protein
MCGWLRQRADRTIEPTSEDLIQHTPTRPVIEPVRPIDQEAPSRQTSAAPAAAAARAFDFYGLSVRVTGHWQEVVDDLGADFAWFASSLPAVADVVVRIERRPPAYEDLGDAVAGFVTPRKVVFRGDGRTIVDYFGRTVSILDHNAQRLTVQGEEAQLAHEAAHQFVLSRVGEHLDACGLTRLHALGLGGRQGAVALLLPSGGGKRTLALRARQAEGVRLISQDGPLLDREGRLHPFPLRVDVEAPAVEPAPRPLRHLVIGRLSLSRAATLERIPRRRAVAALLREGVVGVGLYEGLEFVLQRGVRDTVGKLGTGFGRSACCFAALSGADVWQLTLGRDDGANWDTLGRLLS